MALIFDSGATKTFSFTNFSNSDFTNQSETAYIKPPHLSETPTTEKIRIEDTTIGALDPSAYNAKSSYDLFGLDSSRLEILFSPDDFIFEKISNYFGTFDIDDYIGDPREEFNYSYTNLDDFLRNSWQKYLIRFNINDFLRLFTLYDRGLFLQLEKLAPARADTRTGFSLGTTDALHRNKVQHKPLFAKKPSYEGVIRKGIVEDLQIETKRATGFLKLEIEEDFKLEKQQKIALTLPLSNSDSVSGVIVVSKIGTIDIVKDDIDTVDNSKTNAFLQVSDTTYSNGYKDSIWNGVRLSGPGVNLPTNETDDGSPVVQRVVVRDSGIKVSS